MGTKNRDGISLCMIVRDEAHCIKECLIAARPHVDEIVVVDTGSLDNTIELAKPFTDILRHFTWIDDFSAARNHSLQLASQPWILVLDADEMISEKGYLQLRQLARTQLTDGYHLTQRLYQDNAQGDSALWKPVREPDRFSKDYAGYSENEILRFFRNTGTVRYSGRVHEIVDATILADRTADANIIIHHYHENPENDTEQHVMRNLRIQEILIASGNASARDYSSAGAAHLVNTQRFDKAEEYLSKALDMGADTGETLEALAITHYQNGQLQKATAIYQNLYDSGRGSSSVLNNLSNLLIKAGDLQGSAHLLEQLLNLGIENPSRKERIQQNLNAIRRAIAEQKHTPDK
ncbi:MAG: glycosyltransferase [Luminiphilus sp.]|nr:glycosyltransferase [Luminiphilus sp.]